MSMVGEKINLKERGQFERYFDKQRAEQERKGAIKK